MARGYPDFFGYSIFPWYGSSQAGAWPVGPVGVGVETDLITITGKGVLFSGYTMITVQNAINAATLLYVDGQLFAGLTPAGGLASYTVLGVNDIMVLSCYNITTPRFVVLLPEHIPFGTEVRLAMRDDDALGPTVAAGLRYMMVQ